MSCTNAGLECGRLSQSMKMIGKSGRFKVGKMRGFHYFKFEELCMPLELRPYQRDMLAEVDKAFASEHGAVMLQLATGAGKTGIAATWARQQHGAVLFLCHTLSVIGQAPAEFAKWNVNAIAVGSGHHKWRKAFPAALLHGTVLASTAATAANNEDNILEFKALIIDEAHHAADGKTRVNKLVARAKVAGIPVLGLTATPWRLSKKEGFNKTWDTLICGPEWIDLKGEYLADVRVVRAGGKVIKGAGAYSGQDFKETATLAANARNKIFTRGAFDVLEKHARNDDGTLKKTLMYAVGQRHALKLADIAQERGIPTGLLVSSKGVLDRAPRGIEIDPQRVNERLRSGDLSLVINVNMVTEGYDCPDVECVICLRPTMSKALWKQMCGRGSRLAPDKDELLLIDLTDNNERLGDPLMRHDWSLEPRKQDAEPGDPVLRFCENCDTMIYTSLHECPHCGEVQGRVCDTCGKFRFWKDYEEDPGTCELCIHDQIAREAATNVLYLRKLTYGRTQQGSDMFRMDLSDGSTAWLFRKQRKAFQRTHKFYQAVKGYGFLNGGHAINMPDERIVVEVEKNGRYPRVTAVYPKTELEAV